MNSMTPKWDTIKVSSPQDFKIFKAQWINRRHPELDKQGDFVVLDSPRWVNIIPITTENNVVLIEQYRQGIDDLTIEVPGGLVEAKETTMEGAQRECAEETGYIGSGSAVLLGENFPNPAFLNNKCWSYVWFGCQPLKKQNLDRHEDIRVIEVPLKEIKSYIIDGKIQHSLVLTAFFFFFLKFGNKFEEMF
jgi:ADP-ribose pyrophosphatase